LIDSLAGKTVVSSNGEQLVAALLCEVQVPMLFQRFDLIVLRKKR
jgi:hypothetical protein